VATDRLSARIAAKAKSDLLSFLLPVQFEPKLGSLTAWSGTLGRSALRQVKARGSLARWSASPGVNGRLRLRRVMVNTWLSAPLCGCT
jgi:hypothetical protein